MRRCIFCFVGLLLLTVGYILGHYGVCASQPVVAAQDDPVSSLSSSTLSAYKAAVMKANDLADTTRAEGRYVPASEGLNYFALSVGGLDAIQDLEEGRGVDPETFAAIYAGRASPQVSQHLETDSNNRIRYKGDIVRIYSRERLREVFRRRDELETRSGRVSR